MGAAVLFEISLAAIGRMAQLSGRVHSPNLSLSEPRIRRGVADRCKR